MFNHYVAVDWALKNMAIARMTGKSNKISVVDVPSDIKEMKAYLKSLKGTISFTFEETTTSQWLYTELKEYVDELIVCDPTRNKLLSEGPKNDKIDASKLVQLLKANLLKEVFHSDNKFVDLRKIMSAYEDMIKAGVRLKNQRSALFRAYNKNHKEEISLTGHANQFVLEGIDLQIENYEKDRIRYQKLFKKLKAKHPEIKRVEQIPGIGLISAVKIVSRVVDINRFPTKNHFLSYCGLVKHEKMSGGRSYGKKVTRFSRVMKYVFKIGALATIHRNNQFGDQYRFLLESKNYSERNARHSIARRIAIITYGVMKSGKRYDPLMCKKRIRTNDINKIIDL